MGLPLQHEMQQMVLCRVYNMELAACYLFALQDIFGIILKPALISYPPDGAALLEGQWQRSCAAAGAVIAAPSASVSSNLDFSTDLEVFAAASKACGELARKLSLELLVADVLSAEQ